MCRCNCEWPIETNIGNDGPRPIAGCVIGGCMNTQAMLFEATPSIGRDIDGHVDLCG